jgi:hypothetical protein
MNLPEIAGTRKYYELIKKEEEQNPDGDVAKYINIQSKASLYRNAETYINVMAQIPSQEADKVVKGTIVLKNSLMTKNINISLKIMDLIIYLKNIFQWS